MYKKCPHQKAHVLELWSLMQVVSTCCTLGIIWSWAPWLHEWINPWMGSNFDQLVGGGRIVGSEVWEGRESKFLPICLLSVSLPGHFLFLLSLLPVPWGVHCALLHALTAPSLQMRSGAKLAWTWAQACLPHLHESPSLPSSLEISLLGCSVAVRKAWTKAVQVLLVSGSSICYLWVCEGLFSFSYNPSSFHISFLDKLFLSDNLPSCNDLSFQLGLYFWKEISSSFCICSLRSVISFTKLCALCPSLWFHFHIHTIVWKTFLEVIHHLWLLHIIQMWVSLLIPVYYKKTLLWWGLNGDLLHGYSDMLLEVILLLYCYSWILVVFLQAHELSSFSFLPTSAVSDIGCNW